MGYVSRTFSNITDVCDMALLFDLTWRRAIGVGGPLAFPSTIFSRRFIIAGAQSHISYATLKFWDTTVFAELKSCHLRVFEELKICSHF